MIDVVGDERFYTITDKNTTEPLQDLTQNKEIHFLHINAT